MNDQSRCLLWLVIDRSIGIRLRQRMERELRVGL